jgi:assimilatory nitrate reductase catalytic subunit
VSVKTTCPYCGVGCGIVATKTGERLVEVKGDPDHPANRGKLCSKGTHLGETVGLEGRLLSPMIGDAPVSWNVALDAVADGFRAAIDTYGPDSVAIYGSGQLLTEDYYAANKLMKGFIGSGNIDTNSRLCMASAVAAHIRAFGEDVVPCSYDDIEAADLIILVGSNTAWCHPIIWQRIEAARAARGTKLVVIDPRRTETAAGADLHLPICADGDTALFNGLLAEMQRRGLVDQTYLDAHVDVPDGFWDGLHPLHFRREGDIALCHVDTPLSQPSPLKRRGLEETTGLSETDILSFFDLVAAHPKTLTLFSMGVNQSIGGVDKANAIINFHLATARIGKAGAGPFSITGQPNAMGGREVGGLANTLAAHMGFSAEERAAAQAFWNSPGVAPAPGLKAIDLFRAVNEGKIKAIWIMATNPAVSMPDAGFIRAALRKCPLVIVTDIIADTDTAKLAHIRLPALGWGEKDGTVTNSERVISRQRAIFDAPGETRADWSIIADVARRMGYAGFDWKSNAEVFAEFTAMTRFRNDGQRALIVQTPDDYDGMTPVQWGGASPFSRGRFSHPNGRALLVTVAPVVHQRDPDAPLTLNTGRYRDQWHTMTRTGLSPRLSQHRGEPLLEVNPQDASAYGVTDKGLARVVSSKGDAVFRVCVTDDQRPGDVYVPMHWADQMGSTGRANCAVIGPPDPLSGQPGLKKSPVRIAPVNPDWRGFLATQSKPVIAADVLWTSARVAGGWLIELAGYGAIDAEALLPDGDRIESFDAARGTRRIAMRGIDGSLGAALYITRSGRLPDRDWIAAQLGVEAADAPELLAGRPKAAQADRGPIVCVCFDVGTKTIAEAIASQNLSSVESVGCALNAGTNCGSCRPAIKALIENATIAALIPAG